MHYRLQMAVCYSFRRCLSVLRPRPYSSRLWRVRLLLTRRYAALPVTLAGVHTLTYSFSGGDAFSYTNNPLHGASERTSTITVMGTVTIGGVPATVNVGSSAV